MTRFTERSCLTPSSAGLDSSSFSGDYVLKFDNYGDVGTLPGLVEKQIGAALYRLQQTSAALNARKLSQTLQSYANTYFLTGPKLGEKDLQKIKEVVTMTWTGLSAGTTIKVGTDIDKSNTGKQVYGQVHMTTGEDNRKSYHTQVQNLETGLMHRAGAIQLEKSRTVENSQAAIVTLLHEATHKFAGTIDYCYFNDNGQGPRSDYVGKFTNKDKALINADSYGFFIAKCWF